LLTPKVWVYVVGVTPNGAAIREFRKMRGMSLRQLAHLIDRDPGYLSYLERGQRGAGRGTLERIAEELGVSAKAITREKPSDQD
jgi:transcriptional regulator with XRE-family HTH domain